jgi:hypothetical protein
VAQEIKFESIKPTIRKRDNVIQVGSETQNVGVSGSLFVRGNVRVAESYSVPEFGADDTLKVFSQTAFGDFRWVSVLPSTLLTQDINSGIDYFYVQSSVGLNDTKQWVLNPGAPNMESGLITYKLNSKIYISGSGINSGLYYNHEKGERATVI